MAALISVLLAVAAVAVGMGHNLATAGALQHFCTAGAQVLPESGILQHDAACRDWDCQAVLGLRLVRLQIQCRTLQQ